jgi:hypothetical protein
LPLPLMDMAVQSSGSMSQSCFLPKNIHKPGGFHVRTIYFDG